MQKFEVVGAAVAFEQDMLQSKEQECHAAQSTSSDSPCLPHLLFIQRKVSINHRIVLKIW